MNDQQRAAMQMALEALEMYCEQDVIWKLYEAADALREALVQPQDHIRDATKKVQGEWVDLTDDELMEVLCDMAASNVVNDSVFAKAVIAKFKEKNTPPVVPQGEPVYYQWRRKHQPWSIRHVYHKKVEATTDDSEVRKLYTTPPSVEAAIEATIDKVLACYSPDDTAQDWADKIAAIRSTK